MSKSSSRSSSKSLTQSKTSVAEPAKVQVATAVHEVPADVFDGAFRRTRKLREAIPLEECVPINLDIPTVVSTVIGAAPAIRAQRDALVGLLGFHPSYVDLLEDIARGAAHAHATFLATSEGAQPIAVLYDEAVPLRDLLQGDATTLARRGYLDATALAELKGPNGFKNVAVELLGLSGLLRKNWSAIAGKTAITEPEVQRASELADALFVALGSRDQLPPQASDAAAERAKAYTLLVHAYGEIRAGLGWVRRREDDVESIAPSLWAGRGGPGKKAKGAEPPPNEPPPNGGGAPVVPPTDATKKLDAAHAAE